MDLPAEGWTKKILDALEKVLDQEREILSATMAASRPGAPPSGGQAGGMAAGDVGSRDKDALLNCYRQLVDQVRCGLSNTVESTNVVIHTCIFRCMWEFLLLVFHLCG